MRTIDPNIPYLVDGKPVVGGYVYYGVANQDPKVNPITIYSDPNYTVPISNPQRTNSYGKVENRVYIPDSEYSYLVEDENNNQLLLEVVLNPLNTALPVTQDEDLNGFKFTNVGDATANDQFATLGQSNKAYPITVETDLSSTPNAISATLPIPIDGLFNNQQVIVQLRHGANTDPEPTFKLEPFAPRIIYRDNNEFLNADDTVGLDHFIHLAYNANLGKWELTNPPIQGVIENDIDMDGYKHFNVADADANDQYGSFGQNNKLYQQVVDTDVSSLPNAIVANLPVSPDSLVDGQQLRVRLGHAANTSGAITLKLNAFPVKNCYFNENSTIFPNGATGGPGRIVDFVFNALRDEFQIITFRADSGTNVLFYDAPGVYNYVPSFGVSKIEFQAVGGGGGGGGLPPGVLFSQAGSGAGYCWKVENNPEASYTITVGAGGLGGDTSGTLTSNGAPGGATTIVGAILNMSAGGGFGGRGDPGASSFYLQGGTSSGGDINASGGGVEPSANSQSGASFFSESIGPVEDGVINGLYGSGAGPIDRDVAVGGIIGGNGGNGVVIIKEYFSI